MKLGVGLVVTLDPSDIRMMLLRRLFHIDDRKSSSGFRERRPTGKSFGKAKGSKAGAIKSSGVSPATSASGRSQAGLQGRRGDRRRKRLPRAHPKLSLLHQIVALDVGLFEVVISARCVEANPPVTRLTPTRWLKLKSFIIPTA